MSRYSDVLRLRVVLRLLLPVLCSLLLASCATHHETDLPWATPASWEGTMSLPGMGGDY